MREPAQHLPLLISKHQVDHRTLCISWLYLQQLPLDRLKVDRSFVKDIEPGASAVLAETIVTLGNKLGLLTIAEGVEKREQASYMIKLGCDEAQGYLYAKPMPFDALLAFLASHD